MTIRTRLLILPLAIGTLFAVPGVTNAQDILDGQTAFDNLDISRGRSPGSLVAAGVSRAQDAADAGRARPTITEDADTGPSPRAVFFVDAIEVLFDELNQLLAFFGNRLLARAGITPLLPDDLVSGIIDIIGDGSGTDGNLDDLLDDLKDGTKSDDSTTGGRDDGGRTGRRKVVPRQSGL